MINTLEKPLKLLLLEDDVAFGELVSEHLNEFEIDCCLVERGSDALHLLESAAFDLLLLDYQLPDCTCIDFVDQMHRRGLEIPFVVMTGYGDERVAVRMMKAGAVDYISKDVDLSGTLPKIIKNAALEKRLLVTTEALQINQNRLTALINAHQGSAVLLTIGGIVLHFNTHAEKQFKVISSEATGKRITDLLPPAIASDYMEKLSTLRDRLKPIVWESESEGRLYQQSLYPSFDADDDLKEAAIYCKDITEIKALEKSYLRLQRMESIGNLAGGLAHDFNNILAPIVISAEMVKRNLTPDSEDLKHLSTILKASDRARDIVKQLLTFSRGVEGQQIIIQPKHILRELEGVTRSAFPKNINFEFVLPNRLFTVLGDPTQLHQVLLNLLVNARDSMPEGGDLRVIAKNETIDELLAVPTGGLAGGDYLTITITDTGTGMPKEIQERIFEPFFTTKPHGQGTGLGLSTSIGIIKAHGGSMVCESELGVGTEFKIFLPAREEEAGYCIKDEASQAIGGNGELILVVDDERCIQESAQVALEASGYRVECASDGVEAISIFFKKKTKIKAIVTDVQMPGMDGETLLKTLVQIAPEIPIVVMTGFVPEDSLGSFRDMGIEEFLEKPFKVNELLEKLAKAFKGAIVAEPLNRLQYHENPFGRR